MNNSVTDDYEHDLLTIIPSEMELEKAEEARKAKLAEEEAAAETARKNAEKQKRKSGRLGQQDDAISDPGEAEGDELSARGSQIDQAEEEADDGDEDLRCRIYFSKDEIKTATESQTRDVFFDIVSLRQQTIEEAGPIPTKFNILDFAPDRTSVNAILKDRKRGAKKKNVVGFDEEDEDKDFDDYLADF